MHHPYLGVHVALRDILTFLFVASLVVSVVFIIMGVFGHVIVEHAPDNANDTSYAFDDDDRVRQTPQVPWEPMTVNSIAYFLELCWEIRCLLPYWRGKLQLHNPLLRICVACTFLSALVAQPHGVMETIADPRIVGSQGHCKYYTMSLLPIAGAVF